MKRCVIFTSVILISILLTRTTDAADEEEEDEIKRSRNTSPDETSTPNFENLQVFHTYVNIIFPFIPKTVVLQLVKYNYYFLYETVPEKSDTNNTLFYQNFVLTRKTSSDN